MSSRVKVSPERRAYLEAEGMFVREALDLAKEMSGDELVEAIRVVTQECEVLRRRVLLLELAEAARTWRVDAVFGIVMALRECPGFRP